MDAYIRQICQFLALYSDFIFYMTIVIAIYQYIRLYRRDHRKSQLGLGEIMNPYDDLLHKV